MGIIYVPVEGLITAVGIIYVPVEGLITVVRIINVSVEKGLITAVEKCIKSH